MTTDWFAGVAIGFALAVMRAIVRLYPSRFRSRFGAELVESVRGDLARSAEVGVAAVVATGAKAAGDAVSGLIPEHRSERHWNLARVGARHGRRTPSASILTDVRDALRSLRQSPTFTAVALAVFSLAIGAGTAIFSVVDAVVLRALPFDEHDRIVTVLEHNRTRNNVAATMPQSYLDWRAEQTVFESLAATTSVQYRLRNARNEPAEARGMRISWEFFPVLRVRPEIGRAFAPADEVVGRHHSVILTYGFWQGRFGGAADVIGKTLELNDQTWVVAGVMPRWFSYPVGSAQPIDVFTPLAFGPTERTRTGGHNFQFAVIGRLAAGVSMAQAADQMDRINVRLSVENPGWNTLNPDGHVQVVTLRDRMVGRVRTWMLMLLGSVGIVLLIACANVANLMLARATVRGREMGIRAALGASGWRLTRGLIVEGCVLSLTAAAIGVVLAHFGVSVLKAWMPAGIPRVAAIEIDLRVLGATIAAALATGAFFGAVPAIHGARPDLTTTLREGGRSSSPGAAGQRLRSLLVIAEVALAVVLVVGAGLFIGSFAKLMRIDPGFDYHGVLALGVNVRYQPGKVEDGLDRGRPYIEAVLSAMRAVPGIVAAEAVSGGLPLSGGRVTNWVTLPGRGELRGDDEDVETRVVTPNYLSLLRVRLVKGRLLTPDDREGAPSVVVINQAATRRYWPGLDPIGQRMTIETKEMTVVGVVGDIRHRGLEAPARQEAYMPLAQQRVLDASIVMRTAGDPMAMLPAAKAAIWSVNPEQRIFEGTVTLDAYMDGLIAQRRFNMTLLGLFGVLGLVIAAVGIYGVMAFVVLERVNEIGVRMALGATPGDVTAMVLKRAGILVAIGLGAGTVGAWNLAASVGAFLFEVEPTDGRIFVAALVTLAAAALAASAVPARRAARVDPLIALRRS
jgi:putative ABC transport system permease protein